MLGHRNKIDVWAYYDNGDFFGYYVTEERAFVFLHEEDYAKAHMPIVMHGYREFLAEAKTLKSSK